MAKPEQRSTPGSKDVPAGIEILGPMKAGYDRVLTQESLSFFAHLQRRFDPVRRELLANRSLVQRKLDGGWKPTFLSATSRIRESEWRVAPLPRDLLDRRVEITGPVERKMIINALNSGANVFMADFEDSNTPTFANVIEGQINLQDAVRRTITFQQAGAAKEYKLNERVATLFVRPRGWHLPERHVLVDGEPASGALFDFAMFFFHNAKELLKRGTGPYFYIAKLESHVEARLWNDVFCAAEDALALHRGAIKATVLIETILAAFEMDEILHELREHSAGLNCGRWDYIFSFIKKFREDPACVLPDRGLVTMDKAFLRAYSLRLIQTCHRRGVHAMGGMAPQIPIKDDTARNAAALEKVRADKRREATDGHDGTWVAHPALVSIAKEEFDRVLEKRPNQIERLREDVVVGEADLLRVHDGQITEAGLRLNLNVGLLYLESWLGGVGCVPIHNLMEDAATAEISRTQVWQWLKHSAHLADGRKIEPTLVRRILSEEIHLIRAAWSEDRNERGHLDLAGSIFEQLILSHQLENFLTLPAYERILTLSHTGAH